MTRRASVPRRYSKRLQLHETPAVAVDALYLVERIPKTVGEPACGRGAISTVLIEKGHSVFSTDVVDYGDACQNGIFDFLGDAPYPAKPEAIITNPPFSKAAEFVARAIEEAPLVCMLLPLSFLEGGIRKGGNGPARRKVLDEHPPARIHVFRNRLPMMHRDGWKGRKSTSQRAFAWFVWEAGWVGATEIRRITWGER